MRAGGATPTGGGELMRLHNLREGVGAIIAGSPEAPHLQHARRPSRGPVHTRLIVIIFPKQNKPSRTNFVLTNVVHHFPPRDKRWLCRL